MIVGDVECSVLAAATQNNHLVVRSLLTDRVKQRRKQAFLVQVGMIIKIIETSPELGQGWTGNDVGSGSNRNAQQGRAIKRYQEG